MNATVDTVARLNAQAVLRPRGNRFEDFEVGREFVHHWGRTISASENSLFAALTLHFNPEYTNAEFAVANGHPTSPVVPLLVFNTVFGLSVEDLSEGGGPFLGVDELTFVRSVYPGDTLYARSTVLAARVARQRPGYGIVTWHTRGTLQGGECVIEFKRTNLVKTRETKA